MDAGVAPAVEAAFELAPDVPVLTPGIVFNEAEADC